MIQDITDIDKQMLFLLPSEEQEEDFEKSVVEASSSKGTEIMNSRNEFLEVAEYLYKESSLTKLNRKRGRSVGSKNFEKSVPISDKELRTKSNKSAYYYDEGIFGFSFI